MTVKTRAVLFVAGIAVLLAALPASAAGAPAQAAVAPASLAAAPAAGCSGSVDLLAALAASSTPSLSPAAPSLATADGLGGLLAQPTTKFRGFCHCSCSFVRNCN